MRKTLFALFFLAAVDLAIAQQSSAPAAASPPPAAQQSAVKPGATDNTSRRVLLLSPCIKFESLQDETPLDSARFDSKSLTQQMTKTAEQRLQAEGFKVISLDTSFQEASISSGKISRESCIVARDYKGKESIPALAELSQQVHSDLILALYLRVRVGGKGVWETAVVSGGFTPGQSETFLAAALVDPAKDEANWKNQVLERKILKPESDSMKRALDALFASMTRSLTHK